LFIFFIQRETLLLSYTNYCVYYMVFTFFSTVLVNPFGTESACWHTRCLRYDHCNEVCLCWINWRGLNCVTIMYVTTPILRIC